MSHATQLHHRGYLADYRQILHRAALPGKVYEEGESQGHARVVSTVPGPLEPALADAGASPLGWGREGRAAPSPAPLKPPAGGRRRDSDGRHTGASGLGECPRCAAGTAVCRGRLASATTAGGGHFLPNPCGPTEGALSYSVPQRGRRPLA